MSFLYISSLQLINKILSPLPFPTFGKSVQLWLVLGVFLMATTLRMYATCQQLQAQAQVHAVAANSLLGHTELRLHMPPSIALATRGRLQGLRLQLALLDREFDELGLVAYFDFDFLEIIFCDYHVFQDFSSFHAICFIDICERWLTDQLYLFADYETLRALDSDNVPTVPSMSEEEINALPVHKYKVTGLPG